jgi:hypothetical protein
VVWRRRRRKFVWCVYSVVVVRRRMRRMCVVWLRRRMRVTQVGLEGDGSLTTSTLHMEGGCVASPPSLQELLEGPGGCGGELLLLLLVHGVVVLWCGGVVVTVS